MISGDAPDFELPSLDGGLQSLHGLRAAGPVLLAFFKVSCPTCQLTLPFLDRLQRGRGNAPQGDAPQVVAISQDDATATQNFNRRFGISLPALLDASTARYPVSNAYRITNVPSLFLIESDGRISRSVAGFDKAEMEALALRFQVRLFTPSDRVPVFQPG